MRAVLQRVSRAEVRVDGEVVGSCGRGLLVLLGARHEDTSETAVRLAAKIARLRIFPDDAGRFDRSLLDVGGDALVVSQFTLLADTGKGNRPSFTDAARPEQAEPLVERFVDALREEGLRVETGRFGALMEVELVNDGPVTIVLDVRQHDRSDMSQSNRGRTCRTSGTPGAWSVDWLRHARTEQLRGPLAKQHAFATADSPHRRREALPIR